ncbi:hypothetical protein [Saccharopolyspora griseoalba]|uniref:MmyB-like transcription regulator ligand binding domain-containing protein n=1 Tax=Saccharopolyspora griseoalba TaxID=1431848 RepID=A0ABW2LKZ1_9PSEU
MPGAVPRRSRVRRTWSRYTPRDVQLLDRRGAALGGDLLGQRVETIALIYQAFDVRSAPGQQLILYHAEPGTPSAHALALLSSLHAPTHIENTANS